MQCSPSLKVLKFVQACVLLVVKEILLKLFPKSVLYLTKKSSFLRQEINTREDKRQERVERVGGGKGKREKGSERREEGRLKAKKGGGKGNRDMKEDTQRVRDPSKEKNIS